MARQLHLNFVGMHESISSQIPSTEFSVLFQVALIATRGATRIDITHATLMPDTDRRSGRPDRDGVLCPTHETLDSDST